MHNMHASMRTVIVASRMPYTASVHVMGNACDFALRACDFALRACDINLLCVHVTFALRACDIALRACEICFACM